METNKSHADFVDRLTDILVKEKLIPATDKIAIQQQFHDHAEPQFEEFLVDEGIVEKEDLLRALGIYYHTQAIDVMGYFFDHHLVRMFPKDVMLRNGFIPYEHDGEILIVVAANPDDEQLPAIIGNYVSYDVTFFVGIFTDITNAIKEFYDESITETAILEYDREDAEEEEHPIETFVEEDERNRD